MKVGILGGSFNPIHNGHIQMALFAKQNYDLDKIYFIPTGNSYHKEVIDIVPAKDRMEMARLAVKEWEYFHVLSVDIDRDQNTYTIDTIRDLKRLYPNESYYFILGEDSIDYIDKWREAQLLMQELKFLVIRRLGVQRSLEHTLNYLKETYHAHIEVCSMPLINISSSEIRTCIKNKLSIDPYVPQVVVNYINQHQLYQ